MGSLIQLMGLPAACMLFAWMGRGGAEAIATLVCRLVAKMALTATALRPVPPSGSKAGKSSRASGSAAAMRRCLPKDGRSARTPPVPRTAAVEPLLRVRRPRLSADSSGI